jgi:hypothetical protein
LTANGKKHEIFVRRWRINQTKTQVDSILEGGNRGQESHIKMLKRNQIEATVSGCRSSRNGMRYKPWQGTRVARFLTPNTSNTWHHPVNNLKPNTCTCNMDALIRHHDFGETNRLNNLLHAELLKFCGVQGRVKTCNFQTNSLSYM